MANDARTQTISYGDHSSQFGELTLPPSTPPGVVVLIHGGFWREMYDLSYERPCAIDLAERGWVAWNLEYRRIGNGGGWPMTFDDIAAGIDKLAEIPGVPTTKVVALGHSAGGLLAVWAAGRAASAASAPEVPLAAVISQAGVLDLGATAREQLGTDAVAELMGSADREAYNSADPIQQVPAPIPVWCLYGDRDDTVPIVQSRAYVAAAKAAGGRAELVEVSGDHFTLTDPSGEAWAEIVAILDGL